ncbi:MAG: dephospho-CoA kinase [Candidatus Brockarchaeota archaeon]|nr:dephospho-CoA kinase [Candidatus Brockarchaeota archaeon]
MPALKARRRSRIRGGDGIRMLGLVGLPGSGKSTVASVLRSYGFPIVVMGDAVRREAARRGAKPSAGGMREFMLRLREERGDAAVAELCVPLVREAGSKTVVVDGIRSPAEVKRFEALGKVALIGVFCPRKLRFERLRRRPRKDAPRSVRDLELRDEAELSVGLGTTLALADFMIVNDGSVRDLKPAIERIVKSLA